MPEEELRLDVFASYDDDDLERLEDDLENVDDAIAASGKGNREVNIDVDTDAIIAAGELEALDEVIESVDDDVEIDVETDTDDATELFNEIESDIDDTIDNIDDLLSALENADSKTSTDSADALRPTPTENAGIVAEGQDPFEAPTLARDRLDAVNELQERLSEATKTDEDLTEETNNILRERLLKRSEKDPLKSDLTEEGVAQNIAAEGTGADAQRSLDSALETIEDTDENEESSRSRVQDSFEMNTFSDIVDTFKDRLDEDSETIQNVFRSSENEDDDTDGFQTKDLDEIIDVDIDGFESDIDRQLNKIQSTDRGSSRNFAKAKRSFFNQIDEIGGGLKSFQFTIAAFNQTLVSVFPALLSFVGAIPAAIVALGGLAAAAITAMGALGAIGILGLGGMALQGNGELDIQPILNRLQSIFDAFITAFTPLMKTFVAPVKNAFNTIEALADPLAQAASGLTAFQSLFNDTLATVAQGLPSFTAKLVAFGQAAIPILRGFIQFVNNTDFIGFFAEQLQRASMSIKIIIESVKQLLPFIINLSQGFLLVASVILGTISIIAAIANHFPLLTAAIGAVIGALLLLVTVTTIYTLITSSSAISAAVGFAASLLKTAGAAIIAKFGIVGLTLAVVALTSAITLGLAGVISFSGAFDDLTGSIMGANSSLREFNKLTGRSSFSSGFSGPGNPIGQTGGQGNKYNVTVNSGGDKDNAARSAYTSSYELKQREQTNSIFGS